MFAFHVVSLFRQTFEAMRGLNAFSLTGVSLTLRHSTGRRGTVVSPAFCGSVYAENRS